MQSPVEKSMTTEPRKHDVTAEILLLARNKRFHILIIGLASFIISLVIFKLYVVKFKAYATFFINDLRTDNINGYDNEKEVYTQLNELSKDKMFLLIFSDEMARRLDDGIQVGEHYGLDKKSPYYYRDILNKLRKNVSLTKGAFNTASIEVTDYNMEYSAALANAVFDNLVLIKRAIIYRTLHYKMNLYNTNIEKLQVKNSLDLQGFKSELGKLQNAYSSSSKSPDELLFFKNELYKAFDVYTHSSLDLKKEMLLYQVTTDISNDSTLQNLYLVNKAYPQRRLMAYIFSAIYSLGVALLVSVYYIVSLYFYRRNKHYFDILFKREHSYNA